MKSFNVIYEDINSRRIVPYNVIPYFVEKYKECKRRKKECPKTVKDFTEFIKKESAYSFWARCEYEIIISGFPNTEIAEKWDIHRQVMMNISIITQIVMEECVKKNVNIL